MGAHQDILINTFTSPQPNKTGVVFGYNSLITVSDKVNLFKANKSRLAFSVIDYYSSAAYDYQHWYGYGMIDCTNSKNLFDDVIVLGLYFLNSDNNDLSSVIIGQSSAIGIKAGGSSTYYVKVSIPKEKVRAMTSFFVTKGTNYYAQTRCNAILYTISASSVRGEYARGDLSIDIINVDVY